MTARTFILISCCLLFLSYCHKANSAERNKMDLKAPTKHEMLVNNDKTMTYVRTGQLVKAFEVTGTLRNGNRFNSMFVGNLEGFHAMSSINLYRGTRWARLVDGTRVKLSEVTN